MRCKKYINVKSLSNQLYQQLTSTMPDFALPKIFLRSTTWRGRARCHFLGFISPSLSRSLYLMWIAIILAGCVFLRLEVHCLALAKQWDTLLLVVIRSIVLFLGRCCLAAFCFWSMWAEGLGAWGWFGGMERVLAIRKSLGSAPFDTLLGPFHVEFLCRFD